MARLYHLVRPDVPYLEPHIVMETFDELVDEDPSWITDWQAAREENYGRHGGVWLTEEELLREPGGKSALAAWHAKDDSHAMEIAEDDYRTARWDDLQMLANNGNLEAQALIVADATYEEIRAFLWRDAEEKTKDA